MLIDDAVFQQRTHEGSRLEYRFAGLEPTVALGGSGQRLADQLLGRVQVHLSLFHVDGELAVVTVR
ncbi:hypothetical protein MMOR_48410 [Mycolicibacterium moriokaense]|uniref:Uncharacterized protein n=1 Tax=Mycolicibacterium moriokaense TaxID=39691 RepID=A0AAD1HFM2_9MYCO|nr:hypothetical protein MMOR_48410 [Mycolicibacterium moriokaense]